LAGIYNIILITLCVLIIIIGLFGNIVSILIFENKEFRKQSPAFYLIIVYIVNILVVFSLHFFIIAYIMAYNDLSWILIFSILLILVEFPSIMLAFASLDRLITVLKPFNYVFKNKLKFQLPIISITLIFVIFLVIPSGCFYEQETSDNQTICSYPNELRWLFSYVQKQVNLFRTIIPLIIMIISSCLILWNVRKNRRNLGENFDLNTNQKKDYQMSKVLITSDVTFLIFKLPTLINIFFNFKAK
jgi:hypothetical protein